MKLFGALWRRGGKRKEALELPLWNLNSTLNSPVAPRQLSSQISANQREGETSANANKHWKANDVIPNVIFANQHFASTFFDAKFKFKFLFPPAARVPWRACFFKQNYCHPRFAVFFCSPVVLRKFTNYFLPYLIDRWKSWRQDIRTITVWRVLWINVTSSVIQSTAGNVIDLQLICFVCTIQITWCSPGKLPFVVS